MPVQCAGVTREPTELPDSDAFRALLPRLLAAGVADAAAAKAAAAAVSARVDGWDEPTLASARDSLAEVGLGLRVHDADPGLRELSRTWCGIVLAGSALRGAEHLLAATASGPTALVCNHLSYIDSNAIDWILCRHDRRELADRLVSVAGPKVYEDAFRRVASASLGTLPVPQSESLGHTARLPGRATARQALEAVEHAHAAMRAGRVLLIYPEGSRTRTGRLRPFLRATYRYFKPPGTRIVPAALVGTDRVMGVGQRAARPATCSLVLGAPLDVGACGGPRAALAAAHEAVSALLPDALRPELGDEPSD